VVEVTFVLVDEDRLTAHLEHEHLGDRPERKRSGHAPGDAGHLRNVLAAAGKRHHRVQGKRQRAPFSEWVKHAKTMPAAGVRDQPAFHLHAGRGEAGGETGKGVVGYREQHQVGLLYDLLWPTNRHVRQDRGQPAERRLRHRGGRDDPVTRSGQGGSHRGTCPARTYQADRELSRVRRVRLASRHAHRRRPRWPSGPWLPFLPRPSFLP